MCSSDLGVRMARRRASTTGRDRSATPRRAAVRRRDALPVGAPGYTTEELRGRSFFEKLRLWLTFHRDGGRTVFTKASLATIFFGDELEEALRRAVDGHVAGGGDRDTRQRVLDRYRKSVQRTVEALQKMDVPIIDVDKEGRPIDEVDDDRADATRRTREKRWKYDASSHRAEVLARLDQPTGLPSWEIVGMLACEELIRDLGPTKAVEGVKSVAARIRAKVPKELYDEIGRAHV